ncbi:hypothetical protein TNCV_4881611 [Trichonephila clavipes]|nr:hypothetical protein TNCV_4881611 [Trichonephila clavipes]
MQKTVDFKGNEDEILTPVQEESDPVDDETDEDEDNNYNKSRKCPSNADAFSALETAMEYFSQYLNSFLPNNYERSILHRFTDSSLVGLHSTFILRDCQSLVGSVMDL